MKTKNLRQLTASILGIDSVKGHRTAVIIPEGATVELVHGPPGDARMVDVLWQGRTLAVFGEDLSERGQNVKPAARVHRAGCFCGSGLNFLLRLQGRRAGGPVSGRARALSGI
jgi:hypothetical protein